MLKGFMIKLVSIVLPVRLTKDGIYFYFKVRKSEDSFNGLLEFPGGKIEQDESPKMCAKREFLEECDIDIAQDEFRDFSIHKFNYSDFSVWLYSFFIDANLIDDKKEEFREEFISYESEDIKVNTLEANYKIIKDFLKVMKELGSHE